MNEFRGAIYLMAAAVLSDASGFFFAAASESGLDVRELIEPSEFTFRSWGVEDGLPRNSITALARTADGFLWIGLFDGLARFDGSRFRIFDVHSVEALHSHSIRSLQVDDGGGLWIGTAGGGLTSFLNGAFATYHTREFDVASNFVGASLVDEEGVVYLGGSGNGITEFRDGALIAYGAPYEHVSIRAISALFQDQAGRIWAGSDAGLLRLRSDPDFASRTPGSLLFPTTGGAPAKAWKLESMPKSAAGSKAVVIDQLPDQRLAVLYNTGRLFLETEPESGAFELEVDLRDKFPEIQAWEDTRCMAIEPGGAIWIGDQAAGLFRIKNGEAGYIPEFGERYGNKIWALLVDESDNIWVGGMDTGLVRLRRRAFVTYTRENGLSGDVISSVMEDSKGRVWVGTSVHGVNVIHDGKVVRERPAGAKGASAIFSMVETSEGDLILGTYGDGLRVCVPGKDEHGSLSLELNRYHPSGASTLPTHVTALAHATGGALWCGSYGQHIFSLSSNPVREVKYEQPLVSAFIRAAAPRSEGGMWIGGRDGLLHLEQGGGLTKIPESSGLPRCEIYSLFVDEDGVLWVGTYGEGLFRRAGERFVRYSLGESFVSNVAGSILEDDLGYLWIGTMAGIRQALKEPILRDQEPRWRGFGLADGLESLEFSGGHQPSAWKARDGRLWFATAKGVSVVDPKRLKNRSPSLQPYLAGVMVDGAAVANAVGAPEGKGRASWTKHSPVTPVFSVEPDKTHWLPNDSVRISSSARRLEIRLGAQCFTDPEAMSFRYRLAGLDSRWREAERGRSVSYYDLPPGSYRFEFKTLLFGDEQNFHVATLPIFVTPLIWETAWFRGCAMLLVGGGLLTVVRRLSQRRLRRQLEAVDRENQLQMERNRISETLHDDLGANLTQIALLSDMLKSETSSEMAARIASQARSSIMRLDEIVWAVNSKNDRTESLIDYLSRHAHEIFASLSVRVRFYVPENIRDYTVPTPMRHEIFLAFKEAVANAAKHSNSDEVRIVFDVNENDWAIKVVDFGRGFDPETLQTDRNGLHNIKNRMRRIGGKAVVTGTPGKGTEVTLIFSIQVRSESHPIQNSKRNRLR